MNASIAAKLERCMSRLLAGRLLYQMRNGQWTFGGNKFVPDRVARKLPIEESYTCNDGRVAFKLTAQATAREDNN